MDGGDARSVCRFCAFQLDGIAFTPGDGEAAFFDGIYLAKSPEDFKDCPAALPADQPLPVFEDQPEFVANLSQGAGTATLLSEDHFTGAASVRVTPEQRYNPALPGLGVKIRQNPAPGEYRYLQFAWKKQGGQRVCLQVNHDGQWGPVPSVSPLKFRYDAGPGPGESYGGASGWTRSCPRGGSWSHAICLPISASSRSRGWPCARWMANSRYLITSTWGGGWRF